MGKNLLVCLLVVIILAGCQFNLNGDILPPLSQSTEPTPVQLSLHLYPLIPPDPQAGASVFLEQCAPCHGINGLGDGALASHLPFRVASLQDPDVFLDSSPETWFHLVTFGNMQTGMPSFQFLSESDRWNSVAYALLLGITTKDLERGRVLYSETCTDCHDENGRGNGIVQRQRNLQVPNFQNTQVLTSISTQQVWNVISNGQNSDMPAFAPQLSEADRWALAAYIRTLSFWSEPVMTNTILTPTEQAEPETTPVEQPVMDSFALSGNVENNIGNPLPSGMFATIEGYDTFAGAATLELAWQASTPLALDGSYFLSDIPLVENRVYLVTVNYQGLAFRSDSVVAENIQPGSTLQLPVTVFDSSTDMAALRIQRLHVILNITTDGNLQVAEMFVISNPTTQIITPEIVDTPVLQFTLPDESSNLTFSGGLLGDRFVLTEGGFGDLQLILPGDSHQVIFAYELPFSGNVDLSLFTPLMAETVMVMIPSDAIHIDSGSLQNEGIRNFQGQEVQLFTSQNLSPESPLTLHISGTTHPVSTASLRVSPQVPPMYLLVGFILLLIAGWVIMVVTRKRNGLPLLAGSLFSNPIETEESLIDDILLLDDLFQDGKLDALEYHDRRDKLKEQLRQIRNQKSGVV